MPSSWMRRAKLALAAIEPVRREEPQCDRDREHDREADQHPQHDRATQPTQVVDRSRLDRVDRRIRERRREDVG